MGRGMATTHIRLWGRGAVETYLLIFDNILPENFNRARGFCVFGAPILVEIFETHVLFSVKEDHEADALLRCGHNCGLRFKRQI